MENRIGLTNMELTWALGMAFLMSAPAFADSFTNEPYAFGRAELRPIELRAGGDLELSLRLIFPGGEPRPIRLEYFLPEAATINKSDLPVEQGPDEKKVLRWTGIQKEPKEWRVRFSLPRPGYYKLHGDFEIDRSTPALVRALEMQLIQKFPTVRDSEENSRKYLESGEALRLLNSSAFFEPSNIFISLTKDSGRIETWDFGSLWKRLKHWAHERLSGNG